MSLFQCSKCGCCENTALSNASNAYFLNHVWAENPQSAEAIASYREILGLLPEEEFGVYCSACSPFWYTATRDLGVGPNPEPKPGMGMWHGRFERKFYPPGTMRTDHEGNLVRKR